MSYKLFLDDYRKPEDCVTYMHSRIGQKNPIYLEKDWVVVLNYDEFVTTVKKRGVPYLVSFDHDLAPEHYTPEQYWDDYEASREWQGQQVYEEKTGLDCARWITAYCIKRDIPFPEIIVHSMNPVGTQRIIDHFKTFDK
jgi:hypothetical protein